MLVLSPEKWSKASVPVWALVSGLPTPMRQRQLLLMFQAFIDDSGQGQGPVLVLAGFAATAADWAAFSDEWQESLSQMDPPIRYFKMSEAMGFNGEFLGWSEERRDHRVARFYRIIEKHVKAAIWSAMPRDVFSKVFRPAMASHKVWSNPYYVTLVHLVGAIQRDREKLDIKDPIDFIFDDQIHEKSLIMEAWEFFKSDNAQPEVRAIMGDAPSFRDDQRLLPLQAADIHAWWVRRRLDQKLTGTEFPAVAFKSKKSVPSLGIEWTESSLREAFAKVFYPDIPVEVLIKMGVWGDFAAQSL